MKNGYYLSTFLVEGALPCALDIKLRHDQSVSLWKKNDEIIELVRYWELERISGWKQHTYTFYSIEQLYRVIDYLLATVGLKRDDIIEIWGTPSIDKKMVILLTNYMMRYAIIIFVICFLPIYLKKI